MARIGHRESVRQAEKINLLASRLYRLATANFENSSIHQANCLYTCHLIQYRIMLNPLACQLIRHPLQAIPDFET
ncbi:MAG TPA: hypothetical protein DFI00_03980 [Rhodospirillaceae bacterium]|nr:hypothetical protein [Alphaproteobacteria bacterium]MAX95195.1 hypothetical protein [Alphaproteobacteria bacterium]HCI46433.1 hypothetical protein [Rhodospirillaceae bacterium]